eukprot:COSAG02_NODE_1025_length_15146_cov_21.959460_14_plen_84_part_00
MPLPEYECIKKQPSDLATHTTYRTRVESMTIVHEGIKVLAELIGRPTTVVFMIDAHNPQLVRQALGVILATNRPQSSCTSTLL